MYEPIEDACWLAGYFSGKVYFSIREVGPYQAFCVGISETEENIEFLQRVRKYLRGIGNITQNGSGHCQWRIHKQTEIEFFCSTFLPLLRGEKQTQGETFIDVFEHYKRTNGKFKD